MTSCFMQQEFGTIKIPPFILATTLMHTHVLRKNRKNLQLCYNC